MLKLTRVFWFALGIAVIANACSPEARDPSPAPAAGDTNQGGVVAAGGTKSGGVGSGGNASGGNASGGAAGMRTGGAAAGGSGGNASGGTAGMSTGGKAAGGKAAGGSGGNANGGTAGMRTGGAATGGASTGGQASGGANMGGAAPAGLVGWWKMDDASGSTTVTDASGRNNHATLSGLAGATAWKPGRIGGALECAGSGGALVPASISLDEITSAVTIAAWVNRAAAGGGYAVVLSRQLGTTAGEHYWLGTFGDAPGFFGDVGDLFAGNAGAANTWVHLAITHDGTTLRLYINGAEVANKNAPGTFASDTSRIALCGNQNDATDKIEEFWNGLIDDVRLYKVALSAQQIAALAAAN